MREDRFRYFVETGVDFVIGNCVLGVTWWACDVHPMNGVEINLQYVGEFRVREMNVLHGAELQEEKLRWMELFWGKLQNMRSKSLVSWATSGSQNHSSNIHVRSPNVQLVHR